MTENSESSAMRQERPCTPSSPAGGTMAQEKREYFSIPELAQRWRCSRGTVYNRLRTTGAKVLDFAPRGKKGKKVVAVATVLQIEKQRTTRLR